MKNIPRSSLTDTEDQMMDCVSDHATQSETLSWQRKYKNLSKFMEQLTPIEEELLRLHAEKNSLIDCVAETRNTMTDNCIHPKDLLVMHEGHIVCKFCERTFAVRDINEPTQDSDE